MTSDSPILPATYAAYYAIMDKYKPLRKDAFQRRDIDRLVALNWFMNNELCALFTSLNSEVDS
jgi:hypothetical protein